MQFKGYKGKFLIHINLWSKIELWDTTNTRYIKILFLRFYALTQDIWALTQDVLALTQII